MAQELKEFFNLKNSEVEHILDFSFQKKYNKGEILFYSGEILDKLYFLLKGTVMAFQVDSNNKKIVWHIFKSPCLIGEGFLLQETIKPVIINTEFLTDGEVIKIDFAKFESHYMNRPEILYKMLRSLSHKLTNYRHFVVNEKFYNATEKVACFLLYHETLLESLKLGEISIILNIQQPTLSNILKEFRKNKLIEDKKFKIIIKDKKALEELFIHKF
ncbi:Crp/Fnr family transcriptional regulator [Sulfurospirillum arcachonense]|uniref:Crp/Fnr family transcriptional regulator n=1 Tax=Sulfurospirillum arcachonense TaxID=57666 RepID=UPI0004693E68|nr:Crp/Fnr family transcriptional regulator [Sulfurospirillum arcachonense]